MPLPPYEVPKEKQTSNVHKNLLNENVPLPLVECSAICYQWDDPVEWNDELLDVALELIFGWDHHLHHHGLDRLEDQNHGLVEG